ncbi:MAG: ferrochelatase [Cyanobacteriota bacterium]|nr:ferrochelatase [Cyanobacteriota bacterium]
MTDEAKVAVLLCGYGEIEHYQEFADYNERALRLLASKFIQFPNFVIPWIAKALEFSDRREWKGQNHYHSPHNAIFESQRAGIEAALQARFGDRVGVFKAFNFCEPFLPSQVLKEVRERGYNRLLIYPLLVVDSIFTSGLALQQINEALADDASWVKGIRYFPSFFDQPDYHQRMADHIEARLSDLQGHYAATQIGILLLNHGSPYEAKGYETGIRESVSLYLSIRERLIEKYPLISLAWMNHDTPGRWTTPDMNQAAENILGLGAKALVFAPIGFATENHETMLDVGYAIQKFKHKAECLHLDCLNDDPAFLQMVADWVEPLVGDLLGDQINLRQWLSNPAPQKELAGVLPNRNRHLHETLPPSAHAHHGHSHSHGGHHHHH